MLLTVVSLSPFLVSSLVVSAGLLVGYVVMAPRYWRGEPATLRPREPLWWFLSPQAWWAVTRSYCAFGPPVVGMFVCGSLLSAVPEDSTAATVLGLAGAGMMALAVSLTFSIARYNRPRRLVPPSRRSEPGLRDAS